MKKPNDFLIYPSISKYILNPDLLYDKKNHIRIDVIVTGILPIKICIFTEGIIMMATGNFSFHFGNVENLLRC